ncbi:Uncharacterised protein [Mycobacteroides abscessus subsp. abscessus]|nr:Uncharacterised protein [Mycobacteroides abscessus subsp. abscessus]
MKESAWDLGSEQTFPLIRQKLLRNILKNYRQIIFINSMSDSDGGY